MIEWKQEEIGLGSFIEKVPFWVRLKPLNLEQILIGSVLSNELEV